MVCIPGSEHVEFPLSEIEQRCESQNSKYADRDLTLKDADATNLNIEVLINKGRLKYFSFEILINISIRSLVDFNIFRVFFTYVTYS